MKFSQIKTQRALRRLELSRHPSYMVIPEEYGEDLNSPNWVHIQLRPDLPRNSQPPAHTVRNGSIYMKSRNVPGKGIRGGMVLLLDLNRAASVLADDTYEVATDADIAQELKRQEKYKVEMAARDLQLRMQAGGVENTINVAPSAPSPVTVNFTIPEGYELKPKASAPVPETPAAEPAAAPKRRRARTTTASVPTESEPVQE